MNDTIYTYLASPYSHPSEFVREHRYIAAKAATVFLLKQSVWIYSPIVHCHELAKTSSLPKDFDYWQNYNRAMLRGATDLLVLKIEGWAESKGVAAEVKYAIELGKLVGACWPVRLDLLEFKQSIELGISRHGRCRQNNTNS